MDIVFRDHTPLRHLQNLNNFQLCDLQISASLWNY